MALIPLILPLYPSVPLSPGVPPVLRQAGFAVSRAINQVGGVVNQVTGAINQVAGIVNNVAGAISNTIGAISDTLLNAQFLLTGDTPLASSGSQSPQWGIFDSSGNPVIVGDNVMSVEFRKEARVSDFPIENGGFASYDKVQTPFDAQVQFTSSDISNFLSSLEYAWRSLNLYTVVTPEIFYQNANVVRYSYKRDSKNGVTLVGADVWVREIRVAADAAFTSSQGQQDSGTGTGPTEPTPPAPTGDNASDPGQPPGQQDAPQDAPPANVGTAPQENNGTAQQSGFTISPSGNLLLNGQDEGAAPTYGTSGGGSDTNGISGTAAVDAANPRPGEPGYSQAAASNAP